MNETSESTHYQVELTSRQVLAALVVLLVCLFASFFAGVWIGRNAEADQAALELARVDTAGRTNERFDFFSRTKAPDGAVGAASSPAADDAATALDDLGRNQGTSLAEADFGPDPDDAEIDRAGLGDEGAGVDPDSLFEDDPAAEGDDGELTPPEEMGRGGRRRRAAAREASKDGAEDSLEAGRELAAVPEAEAPAPRPTQAVAAPTAAAASVPARAESGFFIQVLATSDRDKANALVARLVDADFKAFITPSDEGGRTVYRVRVGPFSDRALATRQASELKTRWGLDSWIPPGAP